MKKKSLFLVLTLACKNKELFNKYTNQIIKILNSNNLVIEKSKKLDEKVEDFFFNVTNKNIIKKFNKIFSGKDFLKADICVQENKYRKKKIIACDMDMTAINEETINMIGEKILKNNKINLITEKAMSGKIKFQNSIIFRTKLLKGIMKSKILGLLKDITFTPGIKSVIKTMNFYGSHTMLVTGGYNLIAEYVAKEIGFKEVICNTLQLENNFVTGKLENEIIDKKKKLEYFRRSILKKRIKDVETLAVGDGDNDIYMIKSASLGIAWKAYPKVKTAADISMNNDFENILYFQGYNKKQFII